MKHIHMKMLRTLQVNFMHYFSYNIFLLFLLFRFVLWIACTVRVRNAECYRNEFPTRKRQELDAPPSVRFYNFTLIFFVYLPPPCSRQLSIPWQFFHALKSNVDTFLFTTKLTLQTVRNYGNSKWIFHTKFTKITTYSLPFFSCLWNISCEKYVGCFCLSFPLPTIA